jgi:aminoglycoside N3'-acetyltransferase
MNNFANLRALLSSCIEQGDDVLVHSSLRAVGGGEGGAEAILDLLSGLVGDSGTLIMMTATTSFASTKSFDLLNTPSETGALTEVMRQRRPRNRSFVPMTSFVAAGAREAEYLQQFNSYLDLASPFSRLLQNSGKILLLGVGFDRCTLYHLAEERSQVPYNAYKKFDGVGIDADNAVKRVSQTYFVRKDLALKKDPDFVSRPFAADKSRCFSSSFGLGHVYVFHAAAYDEFISRCVSEDALCLVKGSHNKWPLT